MVGAADEMTGQGIVEFVILRGNDTETDSLDSELKAPVVKGIGPIVKPQRILVVPGLPKTRSGKIMPRLPSTSPRTAPSATPTTLQDSNVLSLNRADSGDEALIQMNGMRTWSLRLGRETPCTRWAPSTNRYCTTDGPGREQLQMP